MLQLGQSISTLFPFVLVSLASIVTQNRKRGKTKLILLGVPAPLLASWIVPSFTPPLWPFQAFRRTLAWRKWFDRGKIRPV